MKTMTQLEAYKAVRKPLPPAGRVERPTKGGGYRRKDKWNRKYDND
jgi:hypothetical protein